MKKILFFVLIIMAANILVAQNNKSTTKEPKNKVLALQLDSIFAADQACRTELQNMVVSGKIDTPKLMTLAFKMQAQDAIDLAKVEKILTTYGWLDSNEVGHDGNQALFLVIQHSGLQVQEKYLPMMQKAVKDGKASGSDLAMLEDRVNVGEGKKQVYGTQFGTDPNTGDLVISPIEDPDNLDKRRASVGLSTMAEYCKYSNLKWDLDRYKKGIPLEKLDPADNPMNK